MALGDVIKQKDVQGAIAAGLLDNFLTYLKENNIVLTGRTAAALDAARVVLGVYGLWETAERPGEITFGRGILNAEIPLLMYELKMLALNLQKTTLSAPAVTYIPPSTPPTPIPLYESYR
ncbi:MAG: hypothetical protein QXO62_06705 [Thermoproteota archaeon]